MKQGLKELLFFLLSFIKVIVGMCLISALLVSLFFLADWTIDVLAIETALNKALGVYLDWLIIIGIYFIVMTFVPIIRIDKHSPAGKWEQTIFYLSSLLIVFIVIYILGSFYPLDLANQDLKIPTKKETYTNIIFTLLVVLPPYLLGIRQGLKDDSKMTAAEKWRIKRDAERDSAGQM